MVNLPDISDLIEAEKRFEESRKEVDLAKEAFELLQDKVVDRYKKAGVTPDDCDHPVVRYCGMGENECRCCGEVNPGYGKK